MLDVGLQLPIGLLAAMAIAVAAHRLGALDGSGAVATAILGTLVFGLGGVAWSVPLITFFLLGSALSKLGARGAKRRLEEVFEKGSRRDAGQVVANGGVAGAIVLINYLHPDPSLYVAFLGSLAAAAADTWGTELGVLGNGRVISVRTLRNVAPGTSGGISWIGSLGAATGALTVAASGAFWTTRPSATIAIATFSGFAGMLIDSLAGATLQARYQCAVCGRDTERTLHCRTATTLVAGHLVINNDVVNILCCLAGAVAAYSTTILLLN